MVFKEVKGRIENFTGDQVTTEENVADQKKKV
jgi:hypothetical protein